MSSVQIEQKSYEMPPREGISIAHFLTVATSSDRLARGVEGEEGQLANIWMTLNVGGGPTPDKPPVNAQRPRPESHQQLYEFPRCGYSSVL